MESLIGTSQTSEPVVYQGQFGEFTITQSDRNGVIIYRSALILAALCFAIGTAVIFWFDNYAQTLSLISWLYWGFCLALGVALLEIHIYLAFLHRSLQIFWLIGCIAALIIGVQADSPLLLTVYQQPLTLFGVGFTFVALTGIFFKEAFCFNRLETKALTGLVPLLLLGHLTGILPSSIKTALLIVWAALFLIFALRKAFQEIPPDIGDKSVFTYLKQKQEAH